MIVVDTRPDPVERKAASFPGEHLVTGARAASKGAFLSRRGSGISFVLLVVLLSWGPGVPTALGATLGVPGTHATIQAAINAASPGDVIEVAAGTYVEAVTISKALDVRGPNWDVSPNTGTRVAEAVILPPTTNTSSGAVVTITASNVSFRGFKVDGDNPSLAASGVGLGGAFGLSVDAARCVFIAANGVTGITVSKNLVGNSVNGIRLEQTTNYFATSAGALRSNGVLVDDNRVENTTGTGIRLGNSMFAKVTNNTIVNADNGVAFSSFRISDSGNAADRVIGGNTISARFAGIWVNLFHTSPYALVNNTITVAPPAASATTTRTTWYGILLSTVSAPQNFANQVSLPLAATPEFWTATGNVIDGAALEGTSVGHGYWLYYVDNNRDSSGTDHFGTISGGSVSNVTYGILMKNRDTDPATNFGTAAVGAHASVSGVTFQLNAGGTGFRLVDDATWTTGNPAPLVNKRNVQLSVGAGVTVTGGATGLWPSQPSPDPSNPNRIGLPYQQLPGGTISNLAFAGQTGDYVTLGMSSNVDATSATFAGKAGAVMTDAELFALQARITDTMDGPAAATGLVRVKAANIHAAAGAALQNGVSAADANDRLNVEAGSYAGGIDASSKAITIAAAGAATGAVSIAGSFLVGSDDIVALEANGLVAGTDHDQWIVGGTVTLGGATLILGGSLEPVRPDSLTLFSNTGISAVGGVFDGYAQNGPVPLNGKSLLLSYTAGPGDNDVVYGACGNEAPDGGEDCEPTSGVCCSDSCSFSIDVCRASGGECDPEESCTGSSVDCPADAKQPGGTACTSDGNPCSIDECDGSSDACQHVAGNAGTTCRASAGVCDVAETCTGTSTACPVDGVLPATTTCRSSAGDCDPAEFCTGTGADCPGDSKSPSGTACTSDGNPCSLDQCDGTGNACQHPAGNAGATCRGAAGACDVAETCTGSSLACPTDAIQPAGTVCRPIADSCDLVAEQCDGSSPLCPADTTQGDPDGDNVGTDCGDNCPFDANPGQEDGDADGVGDACDNCPAGENGNQGDLDGDGLGDVCDDDDGDELEAFTVQLTDRPGDGRDKWMWKAFVDASRIPTFLEDIGEDGLATAVDSASGAFVDSAGGAFVEAGIDAVTFTGEECSVKASGQGARCRNAEGSSVSISQPRNKPAGSFRVIARLARRTIVLPDLTITPLQVKLSLPTSGIDLLRSVGDCEHRLQGSSVLCRVNP